MATNSRQGPVRFALIASAVLAAAAIAVLVQNAEPVSPRFDPVASAAADERLQELSEIIGGTVRQRRAGEILQYRLTQDPIRACMSKAGWDYTPPGFIDMYAGKERLIMGTGAGRWMAPLRADSLGIAEQHQRLAPFENDHTSNPGFERLDVAGQDRYGVALAECAPRVAVDVNFPQSSHKLNDVFLKMIDDIEKSPEVADAARRYEPCMRDAGVPAHDYEDLIGQMQETIGQAAPGNTVPSGSTWQAAIAKEQAAAAADARCRAAIRQAALQKAGPVVEQFAVDHAADLAEVQQDWNALIVRAADYPEGKIYLK